jgi:uncharacterized membrane-anchored protein
MGTAVTKFGLALILLLSLAVPASTAAARATDPPKAQDREVEADAAWDAAVEARIIGPKRIDLLDQAIVDLPSGYAFVPAREAARLLQAYGESADTIVGIIWIEGDQSNWSLYVDFLKVGYIRAGEAAGWDLDRLLEQARSLAEEDNNRRRAAGSREVEIVRWIEPPAFDPHARHLIASMLGREKVDGGPDAREIAWLDIHVLGREGLFTFNLTADPVNFKADSARVQELMRSFTYRFGKWHTDFDPATDRVSAHDLEAVASGVVNK